MLKDWKAVNITPIYKGGDTTAVEYYHPWRPTSLTLMPCKLLESIVPDQVKDHVKNLGVPKISMDLEKKYYAYQIS